jgi:hypothetical protein
LILNDFAAKSWGYFCTTYTFALNAFMGMKDGAWTTLEEDYIAFLLPAPKCTSCIKQVLLLEPIKKDCYTGFSTGPQVRM